MLKVGDIVRDEEPVLDETENECGCVAGVVDLGDRLVKNPTNVFSEKNVYNVTVTCILTINVVADDPRDALTAAEDNIMEMFNNGDIDSDSFKYVVVK